MSYELTSDNANILYQQGMLGAEPITLEFWGRRFLFYHNRSTQLTKNCQVGPGCLLKVLRFRREGGRNLSCGQTVGGDSPIELRSGV